MTFNPNRPLIGIQFLLWDSNRTDFNVRILTNFNVRIWMAWNPNRQRFDFGGPIPQA